MTSILSTSFNQDSTCFVCGTENGFAVFNCDPPCERFSRISKDYTQSNGIGIVEMLFRSNIFALVGGGKAPKYPPNVLMIWDDFQDKCVCELEFQSSVTGVRLRRDAILVSIVDKVYFYNFPELQLLHTFELMCNQLQ